MSGGGGPTNHQETFYKRYINHGNHASGGGIINIHQTTNYQFTLSHPEELEDRRASGSDTARRVGDLFDGSVHLKQSKRRLTNSRSSADLGGSKRQGIRDFVQIIPDISKYFTNFDGPLEAALSGVSALVEHSEAQEFAGVKDNTQGLLPQLRQKINHGDTASFWADRSTSSRLPSISEDLHETYTLIVDANSEVHYDPNFDWARHLPSAVPLDRKSHDRALDLIFKFFTSWCLQIIPDLFLRDLWRALKVPPSQDPPKTPYYSPMLHNALLALALALLDEPRFRDFKTRQYFAEKAKSFLEAECLRPNISVVQALSLVGSFHLSHGDQTLGYLYSGMSTPVSHAIGLNVGCAAWVKSGHMDGHDRIWTLWTAFAQDACWSLYLGRDFSLPIPDLPLPPIDITYDQIPSTYGILNAEPQPNLLTVTFEVTCRLFVISRRIMDLVNLSNKQTTGPHVIDGLINEIDVQLNNWKGLLPPELQITIKSRPTASPHKLMLHLAYWWHLILLHRPFFWRGCPVLGIDQDHAKLCRYAAENIMENLATWRTLYSLRYCPITLIQTVFSAATVYLLTVHSGIRFPLEEMDHARKTLDCVVEYLREIGASWQCAMNVAGILKGLMQDIPASAGSQWQCDEYPQLRALDRMLTI